MGTTACCFDPCHGTQEWEINGDTRLKKPLKPLMGKFQRNESLVSCMI